VIGSLQDQTWRLPKTLAETRRKEQTEAAARLMHRDVVGRDGVRDINSTDSVDKVCCPSWWRLPTEKVLQKGITSDLGYVYRV
jgi:hypothetical protein